MPVDLRLIAMTKLASVVMLLKSEL